MGLDVDQLAARGGVDVGAATDREQHGRPWVPALQLQLGHAAVIPVPLEDPEGGAVAGVGDEQGTEGTVGPPHCEHGHARVKRALQFPGGAQRGDVLLGILAAIEAKGRLVDAPADLGRREGREGGLRRLYHLALEFLQVGEGALAAVGR